MLHNLLSLGNIYAHYRSGNKDWQATGIAEEAALDFQFSSFAGGVHYKNFSASVPHFPQIILDVQRAPQQTRERQSLPPCRSAEPLSSVLTHVQLKELLNHAMSIPQRRMVGTFSLSERNNSSGEVSEPPSLK